PPAGLAGNHSQPVPVPGHLLGQHHPAHQPARSSSALHRPDPRREVQGQAGHRRCSAAYGRHTCGCVLRGARCAAQPWSYWRGLGGLGCLSRMAVCVVKPGLAVPAHGK
ncbi:hypothetical protein HaLaN_26476, partial [Haematococcus lacustris]